MRWLSGRPRRVPGSRARGRRRLGWPRRLVRHLPNERNKWRPSGERYVASPPLADTQRSSLHTWHAHYTRGMLTAHGTAIAAHCMSPLTPSPLVPRGSEEDAIAHEADVKARAEQQLAMAMRRGRIFETMREQVGNLPRSPQISSELPLRDLPSSPQISSIPGLPCLSACADGLCCPRGVS